MYDLTRRQMLTSMTSGLALLAARGVASAELVRQAANPNKWADPPRAEPTEVGRRIDATVQQLEGRATVSDILGREDLADLRPYPRFREAIRAHATSNPLILCPTSEPGERAVLTLRIVTLDRRPAANALVYVYQTSAAGWYATNGYHVRAQAGDERHARLFGYARTNPDGFVEIQTVRPAGYPDGDLPAHFHVEVLKPVIVTEVQFDDDSRLTAGARARSFNEGFVVAAPRKGTEGWWRIAAEVVAR
jgi:hypothetical protein